jgi:hypothetical protein
MGSENTMRSLPQIFSTCLICTLLLCNVLCNSFTQAQRLEPDFSADNEDQMFDGSTGQPEFMWVRGRYKNYMSGDGFGGRRFYGPPGGWWQTDYPDSDRNFLRGVSRYTTFDSNENGHTSLDLTDPALFEYPFLYMNWKRNPGRGTGPNLTLEEAAALREFMLRGGFVFIDDFWGQPHWEDFLIEVAKIFPDRELVELPINHPIFHSFFDINKFTQVPGRVFTWDYNRGFNLDDPSYPPTVHAFIDDDNNVMMVANHNTDMGDGWEHTYYEAFPTGYVNEAYKLGINYLIYAFSH